MTIKDDWIFFLLLLSTLNYFEKLSDVWNLQQQDDISFKIFNSEQK